MNKNQCRKVYEILDVLLYGFVILPGLRDGENRDLLIFPLPDKATVPSYEDIEIVCNYLLTIPKKSVINRGIVVLIDTSDDDWERLSDVFKLLSQLQATTLGSIVLIHLIATQASKEQALVEFKNINPSLGIEVKCHTVDELARVIPAASLPTVVGGTVAYNNDIWVKFRCNVEPFLSDCKSMGKRLEDLVRPLIDVESVIKDTCDVTLVAEKYRDLAAETMKSLHIQSLLDEGARLIERYATPATGFPDMQDTLSSIADALAQLQFLQGKVETLAEKGQSKAESMASYTKFKRNCDHLLHECRVVSSQISEVSDEGLYDVNSVETRQREFDKLNLSTEVLLVSVKRCINEGLGLDDSSRLKDAEKDVKKLQAGADKMLELKAQKKGKLDDILAFHRLVEECMSWFFAGLQRFTAQPVQRCNTLDGICELEQELDKHLSRCPIQGYSTLERYSTNISTKPVISRVKMIKTKFSRLEKIVMDRQEYLRRQKNALLLKCRNTEEINRGTMTGLVISDKKPSDLLQLTQSTQFDPKDIFGCIRNSSSQTDLACVCTGDRIHNLSLRISSIELKLNLTDRASQLGSVNTNTREQLAMILKRLNIIENYLKRLRFSSVYDTFYEHPEKHSSKNSSQLLIDLQNDSFGDSGFNSRPATEQAGHNRRSFPGTPSSSPAHRSFSPAHRSSSTPGQGSSSTLLSPPTLLSPCSTQENTADLLDISSITTSGQSTPTCSTRQYSRHATTSPLSPAYPVAGANRESGDSIKENLADIEKLLIDIEYQIQHDLKADSETQTADQNGLKSSSLSDSSSQTESESETESTSTQYEPVASTTSSTQHDTRTAARSVQCTPDTVSSATDTAITQVTSSSQSEAASRKPGQSQTPTVHTKHGSSQHVPNATSTGIQHNNIGSDVAVQNCPIHRDIGVQEHRTSAHGSSQTFSPETTSSESQADSDSTDSAMQTEMIGLFPASVQTDVQHFAVKHCQTELQTEEVGVDATTESVTKSVMADIKPANHQESSADIKPENHKSVEADIKPKVRHRSVTAIINMKTQGTAAKIIQMFNKSVATNHATSQPMEMQTIAVVVEDEASDTSDLQVSESKTTDTSHLTYYHDENTQTLLFQIPLTDSVCQTDVTQTLMKCSVGQPTSSVAVQTSDDLSTETDAGEGAKSQKRKVTRPSHLQSRSEPHISFRDVSYLKNKTHELRVAKIQKTKEAQEAQAKLNAKKPLKRAPGKSKSKEDVRKSKEDVRKSKEDIRKSKEDIRKSNEDVRCTCGDVLCEDTPPGTPSPAPSSAPSPAPSPAPSTASSVHLTTPPGTPSSAASSVHLDTPCPGTSDTAAAGSDPLMLQHKPTPLIKVIKEEDEDRESPEEEEEEKESESDEEDDWSTASYVFPTEQLPTPIKEREEEPCFNLNHHNLPKKLQYVLQEMLDTEERYVVDLQYMVEGYMEPMMQHPDRETNVLAESVFQYLGQIYSFHNNTFKASLLSAATTPHPLKDIANTFIRHEQELSVYLSFMVHERKAHAIVEQFHDGIISDLEKALDDKLGLSANLIKPTQRMVKYKQFLDIMLAGSEEFEDLEEVSDAQTMITNILNTSNDLCHLQALQLPDTVSQETTGDLLKQADFQVSVDGKQKRTRRVFLFESTIVFSKEETGTGDQVELKYRTKHVVGLDEIGLTPYIAEEPNKCHIWTPKTTFTMFSASPALAETWSKCISNILWGQLKQIKRDRDMSRIRKTRGRGKPRSRGALLRVSRQ